MTKSVKMKSELNARLKELKEEYQKGQERLIALEQETANLNKTMLRISGAIQVLEELIGDTSGNSNDMNTDLEKAKNSEK
jgi:predicted nuclease with TOPRIM domain